MAMNAPQRIARALERLDLENRRRASEQDRTDLLDLAHQTRADAELLGVPDLVAAANARMAEIQKAIGNVGQALEALGTALAALKGLREQDLKVRILALRAECLAEKGDWVAVDATCNEGIETVERYRYSVSSTYLRSTYLRSRISLYSLGVRAAAEIGDTATMLERAELSKCRGITGANSNPAGDLEGLDRAELVARFQETNEKIERAIRRGEKSHALMAKRRLLWDLVSIATERDRRRRGLEELSASNEFRPASPTNRQ